MKKVILSALLSIGIIVILPATAMALSVGGKVLLNNSSPVNGAIVTVNCANNTYFGQSTSGPDGSYLVIAGNPQISRYCGGTAVIVDANYGSLSGLANGNIGDTSLNVNIVDTSAVPEFGIITGFIAVIIGGGAFLYIRHRNIIDIKSK
jgi:hypothetical protein